MATDTLLTALDHRAAEGSAQDPDARFAEAYARHRAGLVGWLAHACATRPTARTSSRRPTRVSCARCARVAPPTTR